MFVHAGPRSLWPVIVFLPWLLLGLAYLLESLLQRHPGRALVRRVLGEKVPAKRS